MALSVSCTCYTLVSVSAECCGYLCYLSAVIRLWPLWSNPVPSSLIWCTCIVPLFLRCCIICHMVLIAQCGKVLWLPLRSYRLDNWISQIRFDRILIFGGTGADGYSPSLLEIAPWTRWLCELSVDSNLWLGEIDHLFSTADGFFWSRSLCSGNWDLLNFTSWEILMHWFFTSQNCHPFDEFL